jgi:3-hydroxyisobutyrate dehydrogenase-like beta-hydroxyacid dehydrogenase
MFTSSFLIKSGFNLVVYNRTADKTRALAEAGAVVTASPKEAASKSDVILTSLRDDAALLEVVNGEKGILSGLRPGTIHIGTSTISPSLSTTLDRMHNAQGSLYLAAPVLGNPAAAKEGKLTTFVAGDTTAIKSCNRLLNSYCQRVIKVGNEHAKANSLKLSANYVMLTILDVMGQVYAVAEKSNIDLQLVNELLEMIHIYFISILTISSFSSIDIIGVINTIIIISNITERLSTKPTSTAETSTTTTKHTWI